MKNEIPSDFDIIAKRIGNRTILFVGLFDGAAH